ncbi:MAG: ATP-binding protein, partial [Anaerotignum sp.]|nr:ATP-binding protein [Anaerotignum sp.]
DEEIDEILKSFQALTLNIPVQSVVYSGLRGVGKTVLLNALQKNAGSYQIFCKYIEVETRKDFITQMIACSQMFVREASAAGKASHLIAKVIDALKSLSISFDPEANTFELSMQEQVLYKSNSLTQSLTDVFVAIGELAYDIHKPVCFFIDEIQYMKAEELGSLIAALHRVNQLGYPIMVIGAGLPKIYKMLADEKSYAERLFRYQTIGSLTPEEARIAIAEPAKQFFVTYTEEAIDYIVEITKGYPFFIQQLCQIIYDAVDGKEITKQDALDATDTFFKELDDGFFRSRYERCSETEQKFLFAMVQCGTLPCTISNVAANMKKETTSISPIRAKLIDKGLIYSARHAELDFTVPEFSGFIQRKEEYHLWVENMK